MKIDINWRIEIKKDYDGYYTVAVMDKDNSFFALYETCPDKKSHVAWNEFIQDLPELFKDMPFNE